MIDTNRSLGKYIFFSIITCGIYSLWFIYKLAQDINSLCAGDGKNTSGLLVYILLSIITFGIYSYFWYYNIGNRLAENAGKYNLAFQENGTTILLWYIFGSFLCGIGPFVAMHILIKNTNALAFAYNTQKATV